MYISILLMTTALSTAATVISPLGLITYPQLLRYIATLKYVRKINHLLEFMYVWLFNANL